MTETHFRFHRKVVNAIFMLQTITIRVHNLIVHLCDQMDTTGDYGSLRYKLTVQFDKVDNQGDCSGPTDIRRPALPRLRDSAKHQGSHLHG